LAAPENIIDCVRATLGASGDLAGRQVLVTAGGTQEPVDPVRYLTNHSSGKMGYAIAEAARDRGARVTLVTTPTALRQPAGLSVVEVRTAEQMLAAMSERYVNLDALVMSAAVADFRVDAQAKHKIKRGETALELRLIPNPDLLAETAALNAEHRPVRVGFAAETDDLMEHAVDKLRRKQLDLIVANDVSGDVFGSDANEVTLLWADGRTAELPRMPKTVVAERVLDAVSELLRRH